MELLPIKPLDGPGGYFRWKESMLLRVHTLGVVRVLFDHRPAAADDDDWAHDDAVCRGHLLAALSDRLLPDYARFDTAADLWRALARTYDKPYTRRFWWEKFHAFEFDRATGGDVLMEQIAHAEALGVAAKLSDDYVADTLCKKLPEAMRSAVVERRSAGLDEETGMSLVWDVARSVVASGDEPEYLWMTTTAMDGEDQGGGYLDGAKPEEDTGRRERGDHGYCTRSCRRRLS